MVDGPRRPSSFTSPTPPVNPQAARLPSGAVVNLPVGTVTFLFTDIEGSTQLAQTFADGYQHLLADHAELIRSAVAANGGVEVNTEGDSFFCVFDSAVNASEAALMTQRELATHVWPEGGMVRVRIGLHTGQGVLGGRDYVGLDVHRAARIGAAGHGGQVVLSETTKMLVVGSLPSGAVLTDLGEHRLKGLNQSEHLYQLGWSDHEQHFPELRTLERTPNNLPLQLTDFIGRNQQLLDINELLGNSRLLTLTGPGGTGKTRLALQTAEHAAMRFPDGIHFVDLSAVTDPLLFASAVVAALGLSNMPGEPADVLRHHLSVGKQLLILDNFEQILDAAPQVAVLLRSAYGLTVLVTSRAPLRISGEQDYPVPPLQVTNGRGTSEAVQLFAERARAARPEFRLTEEISKTVSAIAARLDGLPLAIELAAARVRIFSPEAILERLEDRLGVLVGGARDAPARQQTLRGAIAWSYDLLEDGPRRLLARLSVFVGGGQIDEIEAVADDGSFDLFESLTTLIDHSLLRPQRTGNDTRYRMLDTIRAYATEKLLEDDEADRINAKHLAAFRHLAEAAQPHLTGYEQLTWHERLEVEHDNLRAALHWGAAHDLDSALAIASSIFRFWQIRGYLSEASAYFRRLLVEPSADESVRYRALEAAGGVAYWRGQLTEAADWYEQSVQLARRIGDKSLEADALGNLGYVRTDVASGNGWAQMEEARAIFESLGDNLGMARVIWMMADRHFDSRRCEEARALVEQAIATFRVSGDPWWLTYGIFVRTYGNSICGASSDELLEGLAETFAFFAAVKDVSAIVLHLPPLAAIALEKDRITVAARLLGAKSALVASSGTGLAEPDLLPVAGLDEAIENFGRTAFDAEFAAGSAMNLEETIAYTVAFLQSA